MKSDRHPSLFLQDLFLKRFMDKKKILFVDDEKNILSALRRLLFPMRGEWDIQFATSGFEALDILAQDSFDVIVSDLRMPGMDGDQLLQTVQEKYPQIVRIVLSGQCDQETYIKSIGPTHQYLSKPVELETLITAVHNACQLRDMLNGERLRHVISGMKSLPTLPSLFHELTAELRSPDVSLKKVARIISQDVNMTLKLLQLVNSAYFGLQQRIASIEMAVNMLGINSIVMLSLSIKLFHEFKGDVILGMPLDALWRHCIRTSMLARKIVNLAMENKQVEDEAMIAGLLHDIGKVVLAENFPFEYSVVIERIRDEKLTLPAAEQEIMGTNHAEVGAYVLALWGFHDSVVEAVAYHHAPRDCPASGFTPLTAVHIGNYFAESLDSTDGFHGEEMLDQIYIAELKLEKKLESWRRQFMNSLEMVP